MTQLDYYSVALYHIALDGGIITGLVVTCGLIYFLTTLR